VDKAAPSKSCGAEFLPLEVFWSGLSELFEVANTGGVFVGGVLEWVFFFLGFLGFLFGFVEFFFFLSFFFFGGACWGFWCGGFLFFFFVVGASFHLSLFFSSLASLTFSFPLRPLNLKTVIFLFA